MDKRDALQAQRIEQLEKKMDKHNNLIERTYKLEQDIAIIGLMTLNGNKKGLIL